MFRFIHGNWHLMGQEISFNAFAIDYFRAGPSFGCAQDDHRPYGACGIVLLPCMGLDFFDSGNDRIHRICHQPVHRHGIVAFDEVRFPAATVEEIDQFLVGHASEDSRVGNFISIQIEDGQYDTVCNRIDEFIALPRRCQRSRFGFAITYDSSGNQVGIVKNSPTGVGNRITQFAAFMDGARCFRSAVAGHATG